MAAGDDRKLRMTLALAVCRPIRHPSSKSLNLSVAAAAAAPSLQTPDLRSSFYQPQSRPG